MERGYASYNSWYKIKTWSYFPIVWEPHGFNQLDTLRRIFPHIKTSSLPKMCDRMYDGSFHNFPHYNGKQIPMEYLQGNVVLPSEGGPSMVAGHWLANYDYAATIEPRGTMAHNYARMMNMVSPAFLESLWDVAKYWYFNFTTGEYDQLTTYMHDHIQEYRAGKSRDWRFKHKVNKDDLIRIMLQIHNGPIIL